MVPWSMLVIFPNGISIDSQAYGGDQQMCTHRHADRQTALLHTVWQHLVITIRYDTLDLRELKSWRDGQLNLAHGTETKNNERIKIKNRVAQKKRCRQKSAEAVREGHLLRASFKSQSRILENDILTWDGKDAWVKKVGNDCPKTGIYTGFLHPVRLQLHVKQNIEQELIRRWDSERTC